MKKEWETKRIIYIKNTKELNMMYDMTLPTNTSHCYKMVAPQRICTKDELFNHNYYCSIWWDFGAAIELTLGKR